MQARLALALFLSFLVLLFMRSEAPVGGPDGVAEASASDEVEDEQPAAAPLEEPDKGSGLQQVEPWRETLSFGRYQATFDNRGGVLCDLRLKGFYKELNLEGTESSDPMFWVSLCAEVDTGPKVLASMVLAARPSSKGWSQLDPATALWEVQVEREAGRATGVIFTLDGGEGVVLEKTLRTDGESFDISIDIVLRNVAAPDLAGRQGAFVFTPAMGVPRSANDSFFVEPKAGVCWRKGRDAYGIEQKNRDYSAREGDSFPPNGDIAWAGVESKYFAMLLRPGDPEADAALSGATWRPVWDANWAREHPEDDKNGSCYRHIATDLDLTTRMPAVGQDSSYPFLLFAGPKDRTLLEAQADGEALVQLIDEDLGFFSGIARMLTGILGFLHGLVGNWGVAIILLTLLVRGVLFPFNRRSQTAMARHATKMKRVQPRINELKEKYAKDPRKQREEQARIMQEEGAFPPLGGCLPIFFQIPIFFGLFSALRTSFDLRQAPFAGWIHDLSEPDRFMRLGLDVPYLDLEYLNILPPLMVVLWILQQRVMPKPTDEQAQRMQKMMMWMPVLFGFFLYNYAAGLSLYMITTSAFGILEQTVIKKIWPIDDTEQPKKKGGFMSRLAELQEQAKTLEEAKRQTKGKQQRREKGRGASGSKARRR